MISTFKIVLIMRYYICFNTLCSNPIWFTFNDYILNALYRLWYLRYWWQFISVSVQVMSKNLNYYLSDYYYYVWFLLYRGWWYAVNFFLKMHGVDPALFDYRVIFTEIYYLILMQRRKYLWMWRLQCCFVLSFAMNLGRLRF